MNKNLNLIMNILIIALIVALVFVMMNYYAGTPSTIPTNLDGIVSEEIIKDNNNENIITNETINKETQNDTIININNSGEIETNSGENSGDIIEISKPENNPPKKDENPKTEKPPVIMTSENETSSKEKREILTELDKTLMELLDVVEKVQTVDESRLVIDDSEVQE